MYIVCTPFTNTLGVGLGLGGAWELGEVRAWDPGNELLFLSSVYYYYYSK